MVSHNLATQTAALASIMLIAAFICGHLISISKLRNIPQSTAAIGIGAVSGLVLLWNPKLGGNKSLLTFNPELFYMFMLPPIVLEAGFTLDRINFIRNFNTIMWLAVGGTLISALVTAIGLFLCSGSPTEQLFYCALLGTLLAAVDPVATLGVLGGSRFEANEKLFSIVFGESLLNDTVSIVIFRTLIKKAPTIIEHSPKPWILLIDTFWTFCYASFISCIIGALTGVMAYLCFRSSDSIQRFPEYELGVMLLIAYFSFAMAEMFEGSGIVSLFITSVLLGHYNVRNLSITSQRTSGILFKVLSVFSEAFIYLLLGLVFTKAVIGTIQGNKKGGISAFDMNLFLVTSVLLLLARAIVVFPSASVINAIEAKYKDHQEETIDTQFIARACMHAAFQKNLTSQSTPLAKSAVNIRVLADSPSETATNESAENINLPVDLNILRKDTMTRLEVPPLMMAMGPNETTPYVERSSFLSRTSASVFLEQGSPSAATWLRDMSKLDNQLQPRTPRPCKQGESRKVVFCGASEDEHGAFEDAASVVPASRFGFLPDGKAQVLARMPGQKIHEYVEELRSYRKRLREQNRLYTQVLDLPCQILLWMSGLRGAIAFVLALSVPALPTESGKRNANLLVTTTLAIILVSTIALGSFIELFALKYQIIRRVEDEDDSTKMSSPSSTGDTCYNTTPSTWSHSVIDGCRQLWHSLRYSPQRSFISLDHPLTSPLINPRIS